MDINSGTTNTRGGDVRNRTAGTRDQARNVAQRSLAVIPSETLVIGAIGSIALSASLWMLGRRNWSLFIGQWPPTMLAGAIYMRLKKPNRQGELLD